MKASSASGEAEIPEKSCAAEGVSGIADSLAGFRRRRGEEGWDDRSRGEVRLADMRRKKDAPD
jgi:hypothetical protein